MYPDIQYYCINLIFVGSTDSYDLESELRVPVNLKCTECTVLLSTMYREIDVLSPYTSPHSIINCIFFIYTATVVVLYVLMSPLLNRIQGLH